MGALASALNQHWAHLPHPVRPGGHALRFVPQAALPAGRAYEAHIHASGEVPTRDNAHDFFNGLMWLHHGPLKCQMNAAQAADLAREQPKAYPGRRGSVRDALTLMDENGALWSGPDVLWQALEARQWVRAFVHLRGLWAQTQFCIVGHAALEKLLLPRKPLCVHVWRISPVGGFITGGRPQAVWPVLGVPGWWPHNNTQAFYEEVSVFR
jgi:hypothetical protein